MPEEETYTEYLWRERIESGGEVDKTTIDQIPCDTEQTEERKFSDLEPELDDWTTEGYQAFSNGLNGITEPEVACDHHGVDSGGTDYYGTSNPPQECDWNYQYCPMCGEKL